MNIRNMSLKAILTLILGCQPLQMNAATPPDRFVAPAATQPEIGMGQVIVASIAATALMAAGIPLVKKCISTVRAQLEARRTQKVGVITISGTIINSSKTAYQLQEFFQDTTIAAVVLKIESGGGMPGASQCLYHLISELKKVHKKPVIAWVENIAASGAYYIAAAADLIIAAPSAMVGSIGVITSIMQYKDLLKRYNIDAEIVTAGAYKAGSHPLNQLTTAQRQMMQDLCDGTYKRFTTDMQTSRPQLQNRALKEWADGQIFDADKGLEVGLVDRLGSQLTVEEAVKELTGEPIKIFWVYPQSSDFFGLNNENGESYISALVDAVYTKISQKIEESGQLRTQLTM